MDEKEIELKIKQFPDYLRKEVLDYMEFLLKKYSRQIKREKKFKFEWEGEVVYQSYEKNLLRLNCNIKQWSGDDVLS